MFNYTFKIKNHYELHIDEHSIKVTKEKVEDDCVVFGKYWSAFYYNSNNGEEIKAYDFKTKKDAEFFLVAELQKRNI